MDEVRDRPATAPGSSSAIRATVLGRPAVSFGAVACADEVEEIVGLVNVRGVPVPASEVLTKRAHAFWLAVCIGSHLAWGVYPAFCRYLQVVCRLDGLSLLAASYTASLMAIVPIGLDFGGSEARLIGFGYSLVFLGRTSTNMLGAKFTAALHVQVITSLAPFVVACLSWLLLPAEPLPPRLLPALFCSCVGGLLVITGQAQAMPSGHLGPSDVFGLLLSGVSVVFSAGLRIYIKWSDARISDMGLICWGYTNALWFAWPGELVNPGSFRHWLELTPRDVGIVAAFTVVEIIWANYSQVAAVRRLGPSLAAAFTPLRLLSAVAAAYVLGEPVESVRTWCGLVIIAVVLSAFLWAQTSSKRPAAPPAATNSTELVVAPHGPTEENMCNGADVGNVQSPLSGV